MYRPRARDTWNSRRRRTATRRSRTRSPGCDRALQREREREVGIDLVAVLRAAAEHVRVADAEAGDQVAVDPQQAGAPADGVEVCVRAADELVLVECSDVRNRRP